MKGQNGFQKARDPRRCLEMPDVRLDGTEPDLPVPRDVRGEDLHEGLELDDIPDLRRGAVRLDELDALRSIARILEGTPDGEFLPDRIRCRDPLPLAVAAPPDPADEREDLVPVPDRVGEALEDDEACPLSHHEPIGPVVEGAGEVGGERADLRELDEAAGCHAGIDRTRHGQIDLPLPQRIDRGAQRGKPGGTGGITGVVRSPEVPPVGQPAGDHVGESPGHRVFRDFWEMRPDILREAGKNLLLDRGIE